MTSKILKLLILVAIIALIFVITLFREPKITLDTTNKGIITPYAQKLVQELNKKYIKTKYKYTLYTANFEENNPIIIPNPNTKNILWLGSSNNLYMENINKYDIILTSHPNLTNYLKTQNINSFYFPVFAIEATNKAKSPKHVAIIGDNPIIEEILLEKNIFYQKYNLSDTNKIKTHLANFSAVFVNNANFKNITLDIHPIILEIALSNIPIITQYQGFDTIRTIQLFNDYVTYYINKDDATRLIDNLKSEEILNRTNKAKLYVQDNFSLKSGTNNLKNIIENNVHYQISPRNNTINTSLPTATGHLGAGDYWLSTDLNSSLEKIGYHTSQTYFNSYIKTTSQINIIMTGFLPTNNKIEPLHENTKNILYIVYPQFGEKENKELIPSKTSYLNEIIQISKKEGINAIATASKELADNLRENNVNAYYIPQFTNTKRFYPDYDEKLKSEVFFVGINSFYRKAAPAVLEAGLPITIYGPGWKTAKAPYLDNNILRKHYSSAKIVLNDTREGMKEFGFISNRIFDATACETLIITDYMPEIEEIYGDTVPMYKNKEELINLVKYYLDDKNQEERKDKARRAREITLKNFTSDKAATTIHEIIKSL